MYLCDWDYIFTRIATDHVNTPSCHSYHIHPSKHKIFDAIYTMLDNRQRRWAGVV